MSLSAAICFIACNGAPADHFATFAQELSQKKHEVCVFAATGPALKTFRDRGIPVAMAFDLDNLTEAERTKLASQIAKTCSKAASVMIDVGHAFDVDLQKALVIEAPSVPRFAYYENPERLVHGGYSKTAEKVVQGVKVFFANANLVKGPLYVEKNREIALPEKNRIALGYYPVERGDAVAAKRKEQQSQLRQEFLSQHGMKDEGQKIVAYFGGNNQEYFEKALPAFLQMLTENAKNNDLSHLIFVLQQHPGAKKENIDRKEVELWLQEQTQCKAPRFIISDSSSDAMQVLADGALYYQTTMGPLFALAGIPTIQVGHERYEDVLVKGGLAPSVTHAEDLMRALNKIQKLEITGEVRALIHQSLGIKKNWVETLEKTLFEDQEEMKKEGIAFRFLPQWSQVWIRGIA